MRDKKKDDDLGNIDVNDRQPWKPCFVTLFVPTIVSAGLIFILLFWFQSQDENYNLNIQPRNFQDSTSSIVVEASVKVESDDENPQLKTTTTNKNEEENTAAEFPSWRYSYNQTNDENNKNPALQLAHPLPYAFVHKSIIIPHDSKKHRGGEDAATTSSNLMVVADGVGGWANKGVNPGLFSRMLTSRIVELFTAKSSATGSTSADPISTPQELASIIHRANIETGKQHLGSATCTAVMISSSPSMGSTADNESSSFKIEMQTVNVGDSGYSIHRRRKKTDDGDDEKGRYEVVYSSIPGQKQFNFPHQLGGERHGDRVEDVADYNVHTLEEHDIIVVYSDGVSDNLWPEQYHPCIEQYDVASTDPLSESSTSSQQSPVDIISYSAVADCIGRMAYVLGKDKSFDSPFAQGARAIGKRYIGGKHDDITVVVAQVVSTSVHPVVYSNNDGDKEVDGTTTQPSATDPEIDRRKMETMIDDPYRPESLFLYTGTVGTKDDLPTIDDLLANRRQKEQQKDPEKGQGHKSVDDEL